MKIKVKNYSSQSSLVSSIIFFIIGGILLVYAGDVKNMIYIGIGVLLATIATICYVIFGLSRNKEDRLPNRKALIYGIILTILAFIFIFAASIIEKIFQFIVGGWILFSGIIRLINTFSMSHKNTKFLPLLIVAILLILVGIYTIVGNLFDDILKTVGLIMMIYSVIEIVGFVFYTKDKQEKDMEGTTSIIIKNEKDEEDKPKKKNKVKDIEVK